MRVHSGSLWEADFEFQGEAVAVTIHIHRCRMIMSLGSVQPKAPSA